jgi:uncharacterized protein YggE
MNDNRNLPLIVICTTIILSFFLISRTGIFIKQTGGVESNGKISDTISVSGDGKVYTKPDMAEVSLNINELAPTSRAALDKVNQKIDQAIKIAKNNGVADNDISTTGLNVYTEYDYSNSGRKIIGQRALQSLSLKVRKIDDKATKAAKLIDELSEIDNIQLSGISFDIEDKTKFFSQARELAFNKAKQKAVELAKLSGVKLLKPVSITDTTYDVSPRQFLSNTAEMKLAAGLGADSSQMPSGEMGISADLSIIWGIE